MTETSLSERRKRSATQSDSAERSDPEGIVFVDASWDVPQYYRPDPLIDRFFQELRNKRLIGARIAGSGRVIYPPQSVCEVSFREAEDVVEVGPGGVVRTFTIVHAEFGGAPPPPYAIVFVQLDGASTASGGYLRNIDPNAFHNVSLIGARCRAMFKDVPAGDWSDFWFELEDKGQ